MAADGLVDPRPTSQRVLSFGRAVFKEGTQELWIDGRRSPVESKPRKLLHVLLAQPGVVVSKQELKQAVWPEKRFVEEGSLSTAIYSLRNALGDKDHDIVRSVPGIGYVLSTPVVAGRERIAPADPVALARGRTIPGRPHWLLEAPLDRLPPHDVWLARHAGTSEARVFKFAATPDALDALKREVTISRLLQARLGKRCEFVQVLDWNFESQPYFIETEYGGPDLGTWLGSSEDGRGHDQTARVALVARIARTVATAHDAGILHGQLRPKAILVDDTDGAEAARPVLAGFGDGVPLGVALDGGLQAEAPPGDRGTPETSPYHPPEAPPPGAPTAAGDVFALGILLYQMVAGDLSKPLAAGWESDVGDDVLRGDIAAAAAGDPARRLASAALLAERLETIRERREALRSTRSAAAETARLADLARRAHARKPWIALCAVILLLGVATTAVTALRAIRERDEAVRSASVARAVNLFLTYDLLGRGNPAASRKVDETLMEAVTGAEPRIAFRLATEPLIAGSIYLALAQAFEGRNAYDQARAAYDEATMAFEKAQGPHSPDAAIVRLRRAHMEALVLDTGSLEQARALIAAAAPQAAQAGGRASEMRVWLLAAQAALELQGGDAAVARGEFAAAADLADSLPALFDLDTRLTLRHREAFSYFRMGKWAEADGLLKPLLTRELALHGPIHPDTLLIKLTVAQVLMARGAASAAIAALNDEFCRQLVAVFGADHHAVLTALAARARAFSWLGRYDEAIRDDRTVLLTAQARHWDASFYAIIAQADIAAFQCRQGRVPDGLLDATHADDMAGRVFVQDPAIRQSVSAELAFCLITAQRYGEAKRILDQVDRKAVAQFIGDPGLEADTDLMLAEIAYKTGDTPGARALLVVPRKAFEAPEADPYDRAWVQRLTLATRQ